MRKIPKLSPCDYIDRKFVIKDFGDYTLNSTNVDLSKKGITALKTYSRQPAITAYGLRIKRLYRVKERFYAHLQSGTVYFQDGTGWRYLLTTSLEPYIIPINIDGNEYTLIVGDQAYLVDSNGALTNTAIPYGDCAVVYKDMLFIAKDNTILFSKLNDYDNFADGLENSGFIKTDVNYGQILELIPTKSALIVVCEKAICKLVAVGQRENYSLIKEDVKVSVKKGSVQAVGGEIYLVTANLLCKYKNGSLIKVEGAPNEYSYLSQSCTRDNDYYTLVEKDGNSYIFIVNAITGQASLFTTTTSLLCEGGYFIDGDYVVSFSLLPAVQSDLAWESVALDFDSPLIKSLVGIEIRCSVPVNLEIEYSYGKQSFYFASGLSLIKTHIVDKSFKVKLSLTSQERGVEKIKFIYRLQEE